MYRKNVASQFVTFCMISATDGSPVTGITPTARRCIDGTFAAGGGTVTEDTGLGYYKYAMSQADTNGNNIGLRFTGTGAIDVAVNFVTTAADPTDTVRFGLTALPNAAAEASGGLYTRGSGAGQINQTVNGLANSNLIDIAGAAVNAASAQLGVNIVNLGGSAQSATDLKDFADTGYDPATHKVAEVVLTDTVTTYTGNTPQTGDSFALANGANGFVAIKTDTAAILVDTGTTLDAALAVVDANVDAILVDTGTTLDAALAVVDANVDAILVDTGTTLDGKIDAILVDTGTTLDGNITAIKAKTDSLTFTTAGEVDANIQSVNDVPVTGDGQPGTEWGP